METRKIYYEDAYVRTFTAHVLRCEPVKGRWAAVLDRTAFFPEGGGQTSDRGVLGGVPVLEVHERDGEILHTVGGPLPVGAEVQGEIDWPDRFRKMQDHTGEHIVSGIIKARFGFENVGFHLGDEGCTIDVGGELTRPQLDQVERAANEAVWADIPVTAWFPAPEELEHMEYRSKLDLRENVRIVTIGDIDVCACCAPHVASTGQIGVIKLLDLMRHRGGVRVWVKAGSDALADYARRYEASLAISGLLNAPQADIAAAAERLLAQRDELKHQYADLQRRILEDRAAALAPTEGHMLLFAQTEEAGMRILANAGMEKCGGVCAVFSGGDGAWRFVMASRTVDMRSFIKENGPAIQARGGGQSRMISGRSTADRAVLKAFFKEIR